MLPGELPGKALNLVGVNLVIGQPHRQRFQPLLAAVNGSIYHALRPVAGVQFLGDLIVGDGGGLDLIDGHSAGFVGENAVCPAFQRKGDAAGFPLRAEEHLSLITLPGGFLQPAVDACTLVGAVKAGKAAVDTAGAEQELHQLPDRETDGWHGVHFLSLEILRFSQAVQSRAYPRPRIF
mgnify:CR=1 FL=1